MCWSGIDDVYTEMHRVDYPLTFLWNVRIHSGNGTAHIIGTLQQREPSLNVGLR